MTRKNIAAGRKKRRVAQEGAYQSGGEGAGMRRHFPPKEWVT